MLLARLQTGLEGSLSHSHSLSFSLTPCLSSAIGIQRHIDSEIRGSPWPLLLVVFDGPVLCESTESPINLNCGLAPV